MIFPLKIKKKKKMHVSHIGVPFFVVSEVDMCFPHFGQNVTSTIKGYHFTEGKKKGGFVFPFPKLAICR